MAGAVSYGWVWQGKARHGVAGKVRFITLRLGVLRHGRQGVFGRGPVRYGMARQAISRKIEKEC